MKNMLLIDGSAILTTHYFGTLPFREADEPDDEYYKKFMQTSSGIYTNGVVTTLKYILTLLQHYKPDYFAIAFDVSRNTFRKKMYDDYKGNRKPKPEPLKQQFGTIEKILEDIGVPVFKSDTYEADDLIGSLAKQFSSEDVHVDIITKDHDYFQLASDTITIWMLESAKGKSEELFNIYGFTKEEREKYPQGVFPFTPDLIFCEEGVAPGQIPDLKGIMGDSSDNIPGVKGVASAAPVLLREYYTVEQIYEEIHTIVDDKLFNQHMKDLGIKRSPLKALRAGEDSALLSKELATIVLDIDLKCSLEDLSVNIDKKALTKVIKDYEFDSIGVPQEINSDFYLLIAGTRTFEDYNILNAAVTRLLKNHPGKAHIVSGGARGADALAERYAKEHHLPLTVFPANWDKYGKRAGYIRNKDMHDYLLNHASANMTGCICFWDGKSKGTAQNFELCKENNIPLKIYNYESKTWVK